MTTYTVRFTRTYTNGVTAPDRVDCGNEQDLQRMVEWAEYHAAVPVRYCDTTYTVSNVTVEEKN